MRKVFIPFRVPLHMPMLERAFQIVPSVKSADFSICGKTTPPEVDPRRCILLQSEPPLTGERRRLYRTFDAFHTVVCFNPRGSNQFEFTLGNGNPALYPYGPGLNFDRQRINTIMTKRGIYYAGRRNEAMVKVPDCYTSYNLYGVRQNICRWLIKNYPETHVFGQGWSSVSKMKQQQNHWREQKQQDMEQLNVDFSLCMENSMLKGYISEKIHDGHSSDRVTLYLGEPEITKHVPPDTFICMNSWVNLETKNFKFGRIVATIRKMTQAQYDRYVHRARLWRKSIAGQHEAMRDRMTEFVIERGKAI